jgi:hypothetical protein
MRLEIMSKAWQKHRDKRIIHQQKNIHNSELKKKAEIKTFGQRVKNAWKNISDKKPN